MNPPANWYPDPTGRHGQRYWDGEQWTEHVFTDGVQGVDPLEHAADDDDGAPAADHEEAATSEVAESHAVADGAAGATPDQAPVATPDQAAGATPGPATGPGGGALFVDAGGAQTTPRTLATPDEPVSEAAGDPEDADLWTPAEDEAAPVQEAAGEAGAEAGAVAPPEQAVAEAVEPDDVVASLDEVAEAAPGGPGDAFDSSAVSDLSDAFVLAPETVSRLVGRRSPDEDAPQPDEGQGPGAIDAPPPAMPAPAPAAASGGLGITGDLVGGAFAEREHDGPVALQNSRLLRCAVGGGPGVVARQGTMVAYQGEVSFDRQGAGGVTRALKRAATGEGLAMMRVEGSGDVFFADGAQHVFLLHLEGGRGLSVNGRNVLAFSAALDWDIERVKGATLLAGGLFNTTLTGTGWVALVSDGEPVVLRTDEAPTYVDVNALVAWSGGMSTRIVNSVSAKSLVGLGSGEAFQMAFDGAGIVIVQPSEGPAGGAAAT